MHTENQNISTCYKCAVPQLYSEAGREGNLSSTLDIGMQCFQ